MRSFRLAIAAAFMAAPAAMAQSSDPSWLDAMKEQAAFDKQCEVAYVLNLREGVLGGQPTYEARIACVDGRMFDATRIGTQALFEFKACEIQAC